MQKCNELDRLNERYPTQSLRKAVLYGECPVRDRHKTLHYLRGEAWCNLVIKETRTA